MSWSIYLHLEEDNLGLIAILRPGNANDYKTSSIVHSHIHTYFWRFYAAVHFQIYKQTISALFIKRSTSCTCSYTKTWKSFNTAAFYDTYTYMNVRDLLRAQINLFCHFSDAALSTFRTVSCEFITLFRGWVLSLCRLLLQNADEWVFFYACVCGWCVVCVVCRVCANIWQLKL